MAIFDELKSIGKVLQEAGKIEQYQQILEAQQKLLEMQKRIYELEMDNKKLQKEIEIKENLMHEGNVYWIVTGGRKDGPFCTSCWDSKRTLIRLHRNEDSTRIYCPTCKITAEGRTVNVFRPRPKKINPGL